MNDQFVSWLRELQTSVISVLIAGTLLLYFLVSLSLYPKPPRRLGGAISPPEAMTPAAPTPTPARPIMPSPPQTPKPTVPVSKPVPPPVAATPPTAPPIMPVPSDEARQAAREAHATRLAESLERQTAAREHHAHLITQSVERKKTQIDQFFADRLALAQVEIQGARIIQEANREHELYKAIMARPLPMPPVQQRIECEPRYGGEMAVGRTVLQSPLPEHRQLPTPMPAVRERMYEVREPYEMHEPVFAVREPVYDVREPVYEMHEPPYAVREPLYEVQDEVEEDYVETAHLGHEEEEQVPVMWKNPEPLGERIGRWQQGVEDESDMCSQVSTAFRRRV